VPASWFFASAVPVFPFFVPVSGSQADRDRELFGQERSFSLGLFELSAESPGYSSRLVTIRFFCRPLCHRCKVYETEDLSAEAHFLLLFSGGVVRKASLFLMKAEGFGVNLASQSLR